MTKIKGLYGTAAAVPFQNMIESDFFSKLFSPEIARAVRRWERDRTGSRRINGGGFARSGDIPSSAARPDTASRQRPIATSRRPDTRPRAELHWTRSQP